MRRLPHLSCLAAALLLAAGCTSTGASGDTRRVEAPPDPPNILVIVSDDERADVVNLEVMPAVRRLIVARGTRYANAFATTPLCCPSRASILSGRFAHNTGVFRNNDGDELDPRSTVESYLQDAGYKTALAGKYLQGLKVAVDPPYFDRWARHGWGYYGRLFNVDGKLDTIDTYSTDYLASASARFLRSFERNDEAPWFLYVAPTAPHKPYEPAQRHLQAPLPTIPELPDERDRSDKPGYVRRHAYRVGDGGEILAAQLRTLMAVDDMVRRIFGSLRRLDEDENLLVVYLSDNGHLLGEHGLFAKRLPYMPSVRIPMYARWVGEIAQGETSEELVANIDVAATIFDAAAIEATRVDGISLLSDERREALLLEQWGNEVKGLPNWESIVTPEVQFVRYYGSSLTDVVEDEYYDLTNDPLQETNLLGDRADANNPETAALEHLLARLRTCSAATCH